MGLKFRSREESGLHDAHIALTDLARMNIDRIAIVSGVGQ